MKPKSRIAIVQRVLPHYRVPFFVRLQTALEENGISLALIYGQERFGTVPRTVPFEAPWATQVRNRYWHAGGREVCWQSCVGHLEGMDMVVIEQANRLLVNHFLQLRRIFGGPRLAFWGHGANLQAASRSSFSEWVKARLLTKVDWWFAYTELSAKLVSSAGFHAERITTVQNTIDTDELRNAILSVTDVQVARMKEQLGIRSEKVALFCGGMYPDKKLGFLIDACELISRQLPEFEIIFIGNGPDQHEVEEACARNSWMHFLGPVFGPDRGIYFSMSSVILMPGLVGLAVVDSFVAGVPLFTTDIPIHSPEIAYLRDGVNGAISKHAVEDYASLVVHYLTSPDEMARLRQGSRESASVLTLENMVQNFVRGVARSLTSSVL
jgi:L-malate glycosyltransferase